MITIELPQISNQPRQVHLLDDEQQWAIRSALAAKRPLLVRGEPGIGKTQFARAAAYYLQRPFISLAVDSRTEAQDLLWTFDAVERLAEAQVQSALGKDKSDVRDELDVKKFVRPGPFWWAFNWESAKEIEGDRYGETIEKEWEWKEQNGAVILIDEIDKANTDVPNGLLEALGANQFRPRGYEEMITIPKDVKSPLIVFTSNREKALPDAFERRCFVMDLVFPRVQSTDGRTEFKQLMIERGTAHFPELAEIEVTVKDRKDNERDGTKESLFSAAAELLVEDRLEAIKRDLRPIPGQAEYIDLLRAFAEISKSDAKPEDILERLQKFAFQKSDEL